MEYEEDEIKKSLNAISNVNYSDVPFSKLVEIIVINKVCLNELYNLCKKLRKEVQQAKNK